MPTGKRASMREGPLAALFRKTTEEPAPEARTAAPAPPGADERAPEASPPLPEVTSPQVPSPQERLRQAFSSDIPESLLERPEPVTAPVRPHGDPLAASPRYREALQPRGPVGAP